MTYVVDKVGACQHLRDNEVHAADGWTPGAISSSGYRIVDASALGHVEDMTLL